MKKMTVAAMLMVCCLAAGGCQKAPQTRKIVVNTTEALVSCTVQIMEQENILEKYLPEGVALEWSHIATGPDIRDALISGKVQIADLSLMTYMTARENNLPLRLLSNSGGTPIMVYSNDPAVQSLADLPEDARISITNRSTNLHAAFLAQLDQELGDVTKFDQALVPTPNSEALALLEAGKDLTAGIFSFPTYTKIPAGGDLHLIADMSQVVQEYSIGSSFITTQEFYEKNQDICEAFLKAQQEVLSLFETDRARMVSLLAERYKLEESVVEEALNKTMPTSSFSVDGGGGVLAMIS